MSTALIEVKSVKKSFRGNDNQELVVFDDLNLALKKGEIVALLGKSGSGKSTLLRIIAGLISPTAGKAFYQGEEITRPIKGLSMVFQNFALMPWLTVLQNVELGLEAQGVKRTERRQRALEAIDIVGLDGFESAYPKELSGGMRQRVGFARALVVDPKVLLMDEPFSALDVLTAENLRGDLLDLWQSSKTHIQSILFVTHNIEEAVMLADRLILFDTNPGRIRAELAVNISHPRNTEDKAFRQIVDEIYTLMTRPEAEPKWQQKVIGLGYRLPEISVSELSGFLEALASPESGKTVDLPELAEEWHLDFDDLSPIMDVLEILRFAKITEGDIELTPAGKQFAEADILTRKKIFAEHLRNYVPLARHIRRVLDERPRHRANKERFLEELEDYLTEGAAADVLTIVIDWGRYAEIFAFDNNTGTLSLENPE